MTCLNYSRRSKNSAGGSVKMENSHPKSKEKNKNRVALVYRPFNKGHLQQQWAHPFGKEPPLLPAGFSPRNPLLGVFCPTHRAQGTWHPKGTPMDHIPLNSPDSQVPLSAMDKCNLSCWLCLVKPRNPLSHCSMCPFTLQVSFASEMEGLSSKELNFQKKGSDRGCWAWWVFKASITQLSWGQQRHRLLPGPAWQNKERKGFSDTDRKT